MLNKKKVIHHFNTIFLSKLQGVMTGEVNKKTFAATTQPAKQGKEEVKNRKHRWRNLGQKKSVTFQTFSPLPWNYAKTIFLPFHTDCSSNSTWYFVWIQIICLSQLFPTPTRPDDKGTEYSNGWAHGPKFCVIVKAFNIATSCWCCLHFVALHFVPLFRCEYLPRVQCMWSAQTQEWQTWIQLRSKLPQ